MKPTACVAWLVVLLPAVTAADVVVLRGGGKVTGVIVENTPESVVLETGPGRVTIPRSRIASIRESASDLATYQERAARLERRDLAGWQALARWAAEHGLGTQSQEAYRHVLRLDPGHPEANQALGRVEMDGRWMSEEEANRARGLVPFEGGWLTPAEREAIQRERAAELADERAAREAEARRREAEARAREAEARARAAESDVYRNQNTEGGIPLWPYVFGPVVVGPLAPRPPATPPPPPPTTRPPQGQPTPHTDAPPAPAPAPKSEALPARRDKNRDSNRN